MYAKRFAPNTAISSCHFGLPTLCSPLCPPDTHRLLHDALVLHAQNYLYHRKLRTQGAPSFPFPWRHPNKDLNHVPYTPPIFRRFPYNLSNAVQCDKLTDQHALRGRRGARALHKFLRSFGPGSVDPDVASVRERARRGRAHSLCAPERLYASTVR